MFATLLFSEPFCNLAALYKVIRRKVIVCQVRWLSRVTQPGMRGKLSYPYHTPSMRGKLLRVSRGKKRVSRAWDATDTRILKWWCSTCSAVLSRFSHFDSRRMALLLSSQSIEICMTQIFAAYDIVVECVIISLQSDKHVWLANNSCKNYFDILWSSIWFGLTQAGKWPSIGDFDSSSWSSPHLPTSASSHQLRP